MPSDTLDLLDDIVKGAEGATGKTPGEPLRADDWNALAEAVARLARLVAAREKNEAEALAKNYAPVDHQHLGEVGLTWLDPPTRALIDARGGAGDVTARIDGLVRDTKALRSDVSAMTTEVARLRDSLTDAATDNKVRDASIVRLGTRLDGIIDLDRRVTTLDGRIAAIDGSVKDALAFRDALRDANGNPLDVAGLASRVDTLTATQERLRLADGEVVRMRDFENRIADLEQRAVTDATLDQHIGIRLDALAAAPDSTLVGRISAAAAQSLDGRLTTMEAALAARTGLADISTARDEDRAQVATIDVGLAAEVARGDRVAADIERLSPLANRMTVVEASTAAATARLASVDALRADVAAVRTQAAAASALAPRVDALEATDRSFETRLGAAETVTATIPDLRGRIDQAEAAAARADALTTRISGLETHVGTLDLRITVAELGLVAVDALAARTTAAERSLTDLVSWRGGVDRQLLELPTRAAITDLTSRVATVEQTAAGQALRINELGRIGTTVVRPVG